MNGVSLLMELDTRAGASLISKEPYSKHFSMMPLKPCLTRLHTYTGESIKVLRYITIDVKYCNQHANLPSVVVGGSGPSLLGRDWLVAIKLDWKNTFTSELSFHTQSLSMVLIRSRVSKQSRS